MSHASIALLSEAGRSKLIAATGHIAADEMTRNALA